jgi:hypothetical protein
MDFGNARGIDGCIKDELARQDEGDKVTFEENLIVTLSSEEWDR